MDVNPHQDVFAALASAPRRQVIAFLAQTALSTGELAQRFGISAPAVSRHLAVLQRAGLVSAERQGQRVAPAGVRPHRRQASRRPETPEDRDHRGGIRGRADLVEQILQLRIIEVADVGRGTRVQPR